MRTMSMQLAQVKVAAAHDDKRTLRRLRGEVCGTYTLDRNVGEMCIRTVALTVQVFRFI